MPVDPQQVALLDPSMVDDGSGVDENDPRRRLLRMMSLGAMRQLSGQPDTSGTNDALSTMTGDQANDNEITPAGFDKATGMPTEYPATASKNAAADRLQRASQFNTPPAGVGGKLMRAATMLAPAAIGLIGGGGAAGAGAATGAEAAAEQGYQRGIENRSFANEQYQFEAGREERERDQAIKERVAMAQIEANKAYRTLMASFAGQRVANQGKQIDETAARDDANAQKNGLSIVPGEDGAKKVVRLNQDQLSTIATAKLGVDNANAELKQAQAANIPAMLDIAKQKVKIQQGMLQKALAELELSLRKEDFRETGPTTSSRNMAQMASPTKDHIPALRAQINEAERRGYIGPLAGRVYSDFLAGKVGSTGDPEADHFLGALRSNSKFMTSAMLRTHFNGKGISLYGGFENMLAAKRSGEELNGTLDEFESYLNSYKGMDAWKGADEWTPLRPAARQAAAQKLKKSQGNSGTGNSRDSGGPPPGARIRDYTQVGAGN